MVSVSIIKLILRNSPLIDDIVYLLIGSLIAHGNAIRIIFGVLVGIVGIAFTALEFIPSISPPENFRTEGHVLADDDEEDII